MPLPLPWDGTPRQVQASASTKTGAERALKAELADRSILEPALTAISADSKSPESVEYWVSD